MQAEVTTRPYINVVATAANRHRRWGWTSLVLLLTLLSATGIARLTGHYSEVRPVAPHADPIQTSQTWLATQDYRLIGQFEGGAHITNVTAARHDNILCGDVQTLDARGTRQTNYYRFRVRAGAIETTTTGPLAESSWIPASPSQEALIQNITDPQRILAPFLSGEVRDVGRAGDANGYRNERDDSLYLRNGRPLQVVTHGQGDETRVWRFTPATAASTTH